MRSLLVTLSAAGVSCSHFWCEQTSDGLCKTAGEDAVSQEQMREFVREVTSKPRSTSAQVVDSSTLQNKVLAGYQGWAGARSTWDHWSNGGTPTASNNHFEMVPQMGEYPSSSKHATDIKYTNGSTLSLYKNAVDGVVDLHFKWMKDYGMGHGWRPDPALH